MFVAKVDGQEHLLGDLAFFLLFVLLSEILGSS